MKNHKEKMFFLLSNFVAFVHINFYIVPIFLYFECVSLILTLHSNILNLQCQYSYTNIFHFDNTTEILMIL